MRHVEPLVWQPRDAYEEGLLVGAQEAAARLADAAARLAALRGAVQRLEAANAAAAAVLRSMKETSTEAAVAIATLERGHQ